MLNTKNILFATAMTAMLSSCGNDFLDTDPYQQIGDDIAINKVEDIATAVSGTYYWMGHYAFLGRNMTAIGDIATDNAYNIGLTTHLSALYRYTYQANSSDLTYIWQGGYKVIDHSARVIKAASALLTTAPTALDSAHVYQGLAQAYALRGYATFSVTNVFALPYTDENRNKPGVVLVEEPKKPFEKVSRASLADTYAYIENQFALAADNLEKAQAIATELGDSYAETIYEKNPWFYMNGAAVNALQARVALYKGDFEAAKTFAQKAIELRNGKIIEDQLAYNQSFDLLPASSEAIFLVKKADDDNLSANSLNTLYNNYGIRVSDELKSMYAATDIRKEKMTKIQGNGRYYGGKYEASVANIPVIRLPEMYLIVAECELKAGNTQQAAEALFEVAKRDKAISSVSKLPAEATELEAFIVAERRRELFQEGHRLFDARRTKQTMQVTGGSKTLTDGLFLYPIPLDEINTGLGVTQNENWATYRAK